MPPHKPPGWSAVTPRIFTDDVAALVTFIKETFDAKGEAAEDAPAVLKIEDSMLMVSDGGGVRDPTPAYLYVYVPDADSVFKRALAAGAEAIEQPTDTPYGDRRATVRDQWDNIWQLATYRGEDAD